MGDSLQTFILGIFCICTGSLSNWKICPSNCYCVYMLRRDHVNLPRFKNFLSFSSLIYWPNIVMLITYLSLRNLPSLSQEEMFSLRINQWASLDLGGKLLGESTATMRLQTSGRVSATPLSSVALKDVKRPWIWTKWQASLGR